MTSRARTLDTRLHRSDRQQKLQLIPYLRRRSTRLAPSTGRLCREPVPPRSSWTETDLSHPLAAGTPSAGSRLPACEGTGGGGPRSRAPDGHTSTRGAGTRRWKMPPRPASMAEANHMDIVAASADVITATVLALRAEVRRSAQACGQGARHRPCQIQQNAGLVATQATACPRRRGSGRRPLPLGYVSLSQLTQGCSGTMACPCGYRLLPGGGRSRRRRPVRADRRMEGRDVIERALSHLGGLASPRLRQLIARARSPPRRRSRASGLFRQRALRLCRGSVAIQTEKRSFVWTTPNGCAAAAGSTMPSPVLTETLGTFRRLGAPIIGPQRAEEAELRACAG